MSKVISYKNNERVSVCQIRFDSGEKVLVSFANTPYPSFKVMKLLFGAIPIGTIWEFGLSAEKKDAYGRLVTMFAGQENPEVTHPLDAAIQKLLSCGSCAEAVMALKEVEIKAG